MDCRSLSVISELSGIRKPEIAFVHSFSQICMFLAYILVYSHSLQGSFLWRCFGKHVSYANALLCSCQAYIEESFCIFQRVCKPFRESLSCHSRSIVLRRVLLITRDTFGGELGETSSLRWSGFRVRLFSFWPNGCAFP